jgi:hypothetical protein
MSGQIAVLIALTAPAIAVCLLKGKRGMALFGLVLPAAAFVGAATVALPSSWWANHLYGPKRRARADRRYPPATDAAMEYMQASRLKRMGL